MNSKVTLNLIKIVIVLQLIAVIMGLISGDHSKFVLINIVTIIIAIVVLCKLQSIEDL
jgi:hypothetical protein